MDLSGQQEKAIAQVDHWFKHDTVQQQIFRLMGYAGTGKTTLAKYFAENVEGEVVFAAFTGKAAYVLRQKGCPASTIHSQIYRPQDRSKKHLLELRKQLEELEGLYATEENEQLLHQITSLNRLVETENTNVQKPMFELWVDSPIKEARLIIIDECSMVDERMGLDLLSFGVPILVLGDPAQLPPINGAGYFTTGKPDCMLTEIHRQAADNPIIHLATRVREQRGLCLGTYGESHVIKSGELDQGQWLKADQMIVGKNVTRRIFNMRMRELLGYNVRDPLCLPGLHDRLVCLRNNHNLGLLNGSLWRVNCADPSFYIDSDPPRTILSIQGDELGTGNSYLEDLLVHMYAFQGRLKKTIAPWELKEGQEFDYGYALTCHKAQGSQWDYVIVYNESWVFKVDRHRWLYTAITRAAKHIDIVIPEKE